MKSGRTKGGAAGVKKTKVKAKGAITEFFDSKAGILTATVLALFLWWVPYLGPMAAGFMGGRKAGSIGRGVIAGAVSCILVIFVGGLMSIAVSGILYGEISASIQESAPFIYEKAGEFIEYVDSLVVVDGTSIQFDQSNYFLLIALAIIGGAFADQNRREVRAIVDLTKENNKAPVPRSVRAYRDNRSMGFQSYEDYARMSVNVAAAAEAPERKPQRSAATDVDVPAPTVQIQQSQPTDSVVTTTVTSVDTSTAVPEVRKPAQQPPAQSDDYEFL